MATKALSELSGHFDETTKYNLDKYNNYLHSLRNHTVNIQKDVKAVAKKLTGTVMVPGKWYDDSAAEFADWWNDVKGVSDGIDKLNGISTVVEELVRITAVDVAHEVGKSAQTKSSAKGYVYISKYINAKDQYIWGVEDINKKALGVISETKCRKGVTLTADKTSINSMVKSVGSSLNDINTRIDKIKKLITTNLIEGAAIKIKGLDSSTLNSKVTNVKTRLDAIQDELYVKLLEDSNRHKVSQKNLAAALKKNYVKK